ncbi:hypothetical protein B0F90DRAFT_1759076, partial [Multifurca ochricompacta]
MTTTNGSDPSSTSNNNNSTGNGDPLSSLLNLNDTSVDNNNGKDNSGALGDGISDKGVAALINMLMNALGAGDNSTSTNGSDPSPTTRRDTDSSLIDLMNALTGDSSTDPSLDDAGLTDPFSSDISSSGATL